MYKRITKGLLSIFLFLGTFTIVFGQDVTLKELLSYPYPTNLGSSPVKGRLAWTFSIKGRRNIYFSEDNGKHSSVLLIHADDDRNVSFNNSINLLNKLKKKRDSMTLIIPDDNHNWIKFFQLVKVYEATINFSG
jgi:hypothetical protein